MCGGVLFLFCSEGGGRRGKGGVESNENWRICVGRKRSLYAKAITFPIHGPANTRRRGGRKRGQREINIRAVELSVF